MDLGRTMGDSWETLKRSRCPAVATVLICGAWLLAAPAAARAGSPPPPPAPDPATLPVLAVFDPIWKDFNLQPKMKAEIDQHVRDFAAKSGRFRVIDRAERERTVVAQRIFVMGQPDLAKAAEIARQAGWSYLLWSQFQGVPGKGVRITFTFWDLTRGEAGQVSREKVSANHLKALRDNARELARQAVAEGAAALPSPAAAPPVTPPGAAAVTPDAESPEDASPHLR